VSTCWTMGAGRMPTRRRSSNAAMAKLTGAMVVPRVARKRTMSSMSTETPPGGPL
jgi:hypothetical protein